MGGLHRDIRSRLPWAGWRLDDAASPRHPLPFRGRSIGCGRYAKRCPRPKDLVVPPRQAAAEHVAVHLVVLHEQTIVAIGAHVLATASPARLGLRQAVCQRQVRRAPAAPARSQRPGLDRYRGPRHRQRHPSPWCGIQSGDRGPALQSVASMAERPRLALHDSWRARSTSGAELHRCGGHVLVIA